MDFRNCCSCLFEALTCYFIFIEFSNKTVQTLEKNCEYGRDLLFLNKHQMFRLMN